MSLISDLLGGYGLYTQYDALNKQGQATQNTINQMQQQLPAMTTFKPYTVTSGLGTTGVNARGGMQYNLSPEQQAMANQLTQSATGLLGTAGKDIGQTQQDIYNQIRSVQTPEEERQQLALENRLAAQGRLGVNTAQYGGTPEQLALAKAQGEARNQAALAAMDAARAQRAQDYELGTGLMKSSYMPYGMQADLFSPSANLAQLGMAGQETAAGLMAQLGLGGLKYQNELEAMKNDLYRQAIAGLSGATQNLGMSTGTAVQKGTDFLGNLLGGLFGGGMSQQDIANIFGTNVGSQQTQQLQDQMSGLFDSEQEYLAWLNGG